MPCSCAIKSIVSPRKRINKPKYYQLSNDKEDIDMFKQSIYDLDPKILSLLFQDRTIEENILWAYDSYVKYGAQYRAECEILPQSVCTDRWKKRF